MSYSLFERYVSLQVAGNGEDAFVFGSDFDIEFEVTRTAPSEPNSANIRIMNLNQATRGRFEKEFKRVWLDAGYTNGYDTIFVGEISKSATERRTPDILTTIKAGDGDLAWIKGSINKTYRAGVTVPTIIRDMVTNGMPGVEVGRIVGLDNETLSRRPYVANGMTRDRLNELAKSYNARWSIQNGIFEMVALDAMGSTGTAVVLTKDSGLIEVPAPTEKGIRVTCLLNGSIKPNDSIIVESKVLNPRRGVYKVLSVTHRGSTFGNQFYSVVDCVRAAEGVVELSPDTEQAVAAAEEA